MVEAAVRPQQVERRLDPMKVLHLASYDQWTGAAAAAWEEVVALRNAGMEAHYAFMPGSDLQRRVGSLPFAHGVITKYQDPLSVLRSVSSLRELQRVHGFSILHSHLSHDHWLAALLGRFDASVPIVRTFHALRTLRRGLMTRRLVSWTDGVAVSNASFCGVAILGGREVVVIPPALDPARFRPGGPTMRGDLGLDSDRPVLGVIGKVAAGRGFETVFQAFAQLRVSVPSAALLVLGSGEDRERLMRIAVELGIGEAVRWCGHVDEDLPSYYRSVDVLMYAASGSEEGHRAVIEALGCGTPVAALPVPGVDFVFGELSQEMMTSHMEVGSLAKTAHLLLETARDELSNRCAERATAFHHEHAARRLAGLYRRTLEQLP